MSCNSCSRVFSLLRPEKGCPSCGFSYCSKCLNNKMFIQKLNAEKRVCAKCTRSDKSDEVNIIKPPDAFYRRIAEINERPSASKNTRNNNTDEEIHVRLQKLKESNEANVSNEELADRLQNIKGQMPSTSDAELYSRLAKVKGVPINLLVGKPMLPSPDLRTDQEQADDLLRQYMVQSQIDSKYKDGFENSVSSIETRLLKLKGHNSSNTIKSAQMTVDNVDSDDEETTIRKVIEKVKSNAILDDEISPDTNDELPFCEICNEDARVRCKGCKYLFCIRCFNEHRDDDDGCDKYDTYNPQ